MLGRLIYSTIYPEVERMFIKCSLEGMVSHHSSLWKEWLVKACSHKQISLCLFQAKKQASFLYWHVDGPAELRGELLRDVYGNYVVADSTLRIGCSLVPECPKLFKSFCCGSRSQLDVGLIGLMVFLQQMIGWWLKIRHLECLKKWLGLTIYEVMDLESIVVETSRLYWYMVKRHQVVLAVFGMFQPVDHSKFAAGSWDSLILEVENETKLLFCRSIRRSFPSEGDSPSEEDMYIYIYIHHSPVVHSLRLDVLFDTWAESDKLLAPYCPEGCFKRKGY